MIPPPQSLAKMESQCHRGIMTPANHPPAPDRTPGDDPIHPPANATDTAPAVEIRGFVKRYTPRKGEPTTAVDRLDLHVEHGSIHGLLGPNGAGKTTTIETLVGLRAPTAGTVRVLGVDPRADRDHIRRTVAVQPQHAAVFNHQTVAELLRAWASFHPEPDDPDAVIERMGLTSSRDVRVHRLSGGQRQRLLVGTALVSRPRLLVLDEPSTGLDPNAREDLWEAVRAYRADGGTVLLSTHSMEEAAALCDRMSVLDHGRIAAEGTAEGLVEEHAPGGTLADVFRTVTTRAAEGGEEAA